jgi:polar amino acid transport system permease protein
LPGAFEIHFDTQYFLNFVFNPPPTLLNGLTVTVFAAIAAQLIGVALGVALALAGLSRLWPLRLLNRLYLWFFRGTPTLVQLMLLYFGVPYLLGFDLFPDTVRIDFITISGALIAGITAFGLHEAAYMSEICRSGIQSIERGQTDAAKSLGMWPALTFRRVILPQATRIIIPPLGNQFNHMLKMTSLLSIIGVGELFRIAEQMQAQSYRTFEVYLGISIYYLALTAIWTCIQNLIEYRLNRSTRAVATAPSVSFSLAPRAPAST